MDYLPIFVKLRGKPCLVVGGGDVAFRKAEMLLKAGSLVSIAAPALKPALSARMNAGDLIWLPTEFDEGLLGDFHLVIAATDDPAVNAHVSAAAQARKIPVNVADQPELCTFILPSILDRSPIVVAVSSGGAAPVLARVLRMRLETLIPPAYGVLAGIAGRFRSRVNQTLPSFGSRRQFWEKVLQGPVADLALAGQTELAQAKMEMTLEEEAQGNRGRQVGMVYLVGAGPGDPDLLTLRALRVIQEADIVVYDRLVSPEILELVRREAEKIYAGKQRDKHALPQDEINRLLAELASTGKRVVRLKGGDPFIFGRGGEEIETLMERGIPFQVVPGITAASGCAAYAGIPLTHRNHAQSVTFLTAHLKDGRLIDLDWALWAPSNQTLVFYMSLHGLAQVCGKLIEHGRPAETPAALIQQGTTQHQVVLTGTVETLPDIVSRSEIRAPTLLIIGSVVELREKLAWFQPVPAQDA